MRCGFSQTDFSDPLTNTACHISTPVTLPGWRHIASAARILPAAILPCEFGEIVWRHTKNYPICAHRARYAAVALYNTIAEERVAFRLRARLLWHIDAAPRYNFLSRLMASLACRIPPCPPSDISLTSDFPPMLDIPKPRWKRWVSFSRSPPSRPIAEISEWDRKRLPLLIRDSPAPVGSRGPRNFDRAGQSESAAHHGPRSDRRWGNIAPQSRGADRPTTPRPDGGFRAMRPRRAKTSIQKTLSRAIYRSIITSGNPKRKAAGGDTFYRTPNDNGFLAPSTDWAIYADAAFLGIPGGGGGGAHIAAAFSALLRDNRSLGRNYIFTVTPGRMAPFFFSAHFRNFRIWARCGGFGGIPPPHIAQELRGDRLHR